MPAVLADQGVGGGRIPGARGAVGRV